MGRPNAPPIIRSRTAFAPVLKVATAVRLKLVENVKLFASPGLLLDLRRQPYRASDDDETPPSRWIARPQLDLDLTFTLAGGDGSDG